MMPDEQTILTQITHFLEEIGLRVQPAEINGPTFLPGINVEHGTLLFDPTKLLYPGDLLHEAGHMAVISAARRSKAHHSFSQKIAEEIAAIAWSYAALVHLGLDPVVVFHPNGYKGWSESLIENYTSGRYIGLPLLQWMGLTADDQRAAERGILPYPHMIQWLMD